MLKNFKEFIARGNVLELAVGFLMATYFGAIVKSLANDIIMPPLGKILGGIDFTDMKYVIQEGSPEVVNGEAVVTPGIEEVAINYGIFINTIITFLIIAFVVFLIVQFYNRYMKKQEALPDSSTPAPPSKDIELLIEIRDLLKKGNSPGT